jgi:diacylglycerol O-acyltransferase/trehalose O-mycolyltransferase
LRTTVDTGQAAPISSGARACYSTHLRHRSRHTHTRTAVLLAAVIAASAACSSARPPQTARPANRSARVVATRTIGRRMRDLTIDSPALGHTAMVRLLLPTHYTTQPNRRWPVLWLLHGDGDTYQAWTRSTDVEQQAALANVLVVMPDGGQAGWYSDWSRPGHDGPSRWESFHLTELRQLLERDWRASDDRVIAGPSMGGLGAMAYAARHPGMFRAAASYSGNLHTRYLGPPFNGPNVVQDQLGEFHEDPNALWGDPQQQGDIWAAHNPYDLAPKLRGTRLFVSFGDGQPGPHDTDTFAQALEQALYPQNTAFVQRLHQLGIPVTVDAYSPWTHEWRYWQRELHRSLPLLLAGLGVPH